MKRLLILAAVLVAAISTSAFAELKMIRCVYGGDTKHPIDLIFDLATGTAEARRKNLEDNFITYAAKVQEFPTKLRFTWQQQTYDKSLGDYEKVSLDVDRSTLKASKSEVTIGGPVSGFVHESEYECTLEKAPTVKNKI